MTATFALADGDVGRLLLERAVRLASRTDYRIHAAQARSGRGDRPAREAVDGVLRATLALIRQGAPRVVVALDLGAGKATDLNGRLEAALVEGGVALEGGDGRYRAGPTQLQLLPLGLPDGGALRELGIAVHGADDYLALLVSELDNCARLLRARSPHPPTVGEALGALDRCCRALSESGLPVTSSHQLLRLLGAIIGHGGGPAELARDILDSAHPDSVRRSLAGIVELLP